MKAVKVGVRLAPQHTTADAYREAWLRADELGADSIWTWDHFFPPHPLERLVAWRDRRNGA